MSEEKRRVTLDIDKALWHEVSIESAKREVNKRDLVEEALREKFERLNQDDHA